MKLVSFLSQALTLAILILLSGATSSAVAQQKIPETSLSSNPDDYFEIAEGSTLVLDAIGWRLTKASGDATSDFLIDLRGGLNRAGTYLQRGASAVEIAKAVRATAEFILRRSGVALDDKQIERLVSMESEFLDGKRRGIAIDALAHAFTAVLFERVGALTDEEIVRASNSFRVASLHGQYETIALRMNQTASGSLRADEFITQAKAFRDSTTELARSQRALVERLIREELEWRSNLFARSYPERWGKAANSGASPVKSLLLAYSALSGDTCFSDAALKGTIHVLEDSMKRNRRDTKFEGKTAFGSRGFIYSTPLDLLLNDATTNRLLDGLDLESRQ